MTKTLHESLFKYKLVRLEADPNCWGESDTRAARARLGRAFQMPVVLIAAGSVKILYKCFQWRSTVLLEWDSNLANNCSVVEKR